MHLHQSRSFAVDDWDVQTWLYTARKVIHRNAQLQTPWLCGSPCALMTKVFSAPRGLSPLVTDLCYNVSKVNLCNKLLSLTICTRAVWQHHWNEQVPLWSDKAEGIALKQPGFDFSVISNTHRHRRAEPRKQHQLVNKKVNLSVWSWWKLSVVFFPDKRQKSSQFKLFFFFSFFPEFRIRSVSQSFSHLKARCII